MTNHRAAPAEPLKSKRVIKPTAAFGAAIALNASDDDTLSNTSMEEQDAAAPSDETRRITVWNPKTGKKLSGNAGVFKKNLAKYLRTHPDWVVWSGQDKGSPKRRRSDHEERAMKRQRLEPLDLERCALSFQEPRYQSFELFTAAQLWNSLLAVCTEKSILAEVDADSDGEEEYNHQFSRCAGVLPMGLKSFECNTTFRPFTSPAVG